MNDLLSTLSPATQADIAGFTMPDTGSRNGNGNGNRPIHSGAEVITELEPEIVAVFDDYQPPSTLSLEDEATTLDELGAAVDAAMISTPEEPEAANRERNIYATIIALTAPLLNGERFHRLSREAIDNRFPTGIPVAA